jgi:hypothetical protein
MQAPTTWARLAMFASFYVKGLSDWRKFYHCFSAGKQAALSHGCKFVALRQKFARKKAAARPRCIFPFL